MTPYTLLLCKVKMEASDTALAFVWSIKAGLAFIDLTPLAGPSIFRHHISELAIKAFVVLAAFLTKIWTLNTPIQVS